MSNIAQLTQTVSLEVNAYTDQARLQEIAAKLRSMMVQDGQDEANLTTHASSDNKPEYPTAVIKTEFRCKGFRNMLEIDIQLSESLLTNNLLMVDHKRRLQAYAAGKEALWVINELNKTLLDDPESSNPQLDKYINRGQRIILRKEYDAHAFHRELVKLQDEILGSLPK